MSTATLSAPMAQTASQQPALLDQPVRPRPARVRPAGRSGRSLAPRSRPARPLAPPSLAPALQAGAHSCSGESAGSVVVVLPATRVRTGLRITDRGIALIIVTGAMIVLAAVTVVGLTALRVTGDSYQPLPPAYASQP